MNKPSIQIIYEDFEVAPNGIRNSLKVATVYFSEKTTPYTNSVSYADNFEYMIADIYQNGYVYIDDKNIIPVLNIKKFLDNNTAPHNEPINNVDQNSQQPQQQGQQRQQRHWRKNDRRNSKKQISATRAANLIPSPAKPIKPEEILQAPQPSPVEVPPNS